MSHGKCLGDGFWPKQHRGPMQILTRCSHLSAGKEKSPWSLHHFTENDHDRVDDPSR